MLYINCKSSVFYSTGLNVYSMLKHDTLVLTTAAVNKIEEKLLYQLNRPDFTNVTKKFRLNQYG
jgi:large subunit ribosomal protein L4